MEVRQCLQLPMLWQGIVVCVVHIFLRGVYQFLWLGWHMWQKVVVSSQLQLLCTAGAMVCPGAVPVMLYHCPPPP
jgi:hypothetical protein